MTNPILIHQGAELYGSDKIFLYVVESIIETGEVPIVVLDSDGPLVKVIKDAGAIVIIRRLGVLRRNIFSSPIKFFAFIYNFFSSVFFLKRLHNKFKADVVYVNTLAVISPLILKFLVKDVRFIHHLHEIQDKPRLLAKCLYTLSTFLSHEVIVVSNAVREHLLKIVNPSFVRCKVHKVYNGIEAKEVTKSQFASLSKELELSSLKESGAIIIAVVGRIHTWKGQLEFLDILSKLKENKECKFKVFFFGDVYTGYEWLRRDFISKIEILGLLDVVTFCGARSDPEVLFKSCDIAVLTSIEPDPLPTVVLEAMSFGKPVIAYEMGGAVEMIDHRVTGVLVNVNNQEQFISRLKELIFDSDLRQELGRNARRKFEQEFNLDRFKSDIKGLLKL